MPPEELRDLLSGLLSLDAEDGGRRRLEAVVPGLLPLLPAVWQLMPAVASLMHLPDALAAVAALVPPDFAEGLRALDAALALASLEAP